MHLVLVLVLLLMAGCSMANTAVTHFIENDFAVALQELDAAEKAGMVSPNNPLRPCLTGIVEAQSKLGGNLQSLQHPVGLVSAGVEIYILTESLKQQGQEGGLNIACDPLVGAIVRMGAKRAVQGAIGAALPGIGAIFPGGIPPLSGLP